MPYVDHARKELRFKIVYYGPGLGGKTTNLEYIHSKTKPARRGKLIALNTEAERTLFFDLLPMEIGSYRGYRVRVHLCTVPGQIAYDKTRQLVLRHVDGVVFVVDSQPARIDDNLESMRNLEGNLRKQGDDVGKMPMVVQYNKRDLPGASSVTELRDQLSIHDGVAQIEACATEGKGVFQTFKEIAKACIDVVGDPTEAPQGRVSSIMPGKRSSMFPNAPQAGSDIPSAPPVPKV